MTRRFSKVLIANRGEIACRVIRTAKREGYTTVAVYSDADANALHVAMADESVRIGPAPVNQSYLDADKIIEAAKRTGADAIHPGYGFLSENAAFAERCKREQITFIGPPSDAVRVMGDKAEAKRLMIKAGVPCVPGYEGVDQDDAILRAEVERIGYPVLLKAAAGGGGRGMRTVRAPEQFAEALATARSEARNAFGSEVLIVEKLVEHARHVEIQVLADEHGHCIHLGERDCSVQRRHQKIVEESPCPVMTPELRAAMGAAAVNAAKSVGYVNAGTVEFLLDEARNFYFLEMNTRLQVEHPVTELVTGLDLVAEQLAVAQGRPLDRTQEDIIFAGHAIEVRLYAEDPAHDFAPQVGAILTWKPAELDDVRTDHGLEAGTAVTPFYDAMVAKVIAWGRDREEARIRLLAGLRDTTLLGLQTNMNLLVRTLSHETFIAGDARTHFVESSEILGQETAEPTLERLLIAAAVLIERDAAVYTPELRGWRSNGGGAVPLKLAWQDKDYALNVEMLGADYTLTLGEETERLHVEHYAPGVIRWHDAGHAMSARFAIDGNHVYLEFEGRTDQFTDVTFLPPEAAAGAADGVLKAPMVGQVVEVPAVEGATVAKGDVLVVLEAMKMVNQIVAPRDGVIASVHVAVGGQVNAGQVLLRMAVEEETEAGQ
jgi:geranyl-CoA carboxylase alpha subunit